MRKLLADDQRPLAEVLAQALCPPAPHAVERAANSLVALAALHQEDTTLTPLGRQLALLPLDPQYGKALLCAASLCCLSPVALIVANGPCQGPWGHSQMGL